MRPTYHHCMCGLVELPEALLNVWINVPTNSIRPRCPRPVRSVARSAVRSLTSPRVRQRCAILSRPLVSKKKKFETEEKTGKSADETRKQRKYGDCAKYKSHTETERQNRNRRPNECGKMRNVGILIHTFNEAARPNIRSTHSIIIFGTHESLAFGRTGKRSDETPWNVICRAVYGPYNRSGAKLHGFPVRTRKRLYGPHFRKSHTRKLLTRKAIRRTLRQKCGCIEPTAFNF